MYFGFFYALSIFFLITFIEYKISQGHFVEPRVKEVYYEFKEIYDKFLPMFKKPYDKEEILKSKNVIY